MFIFFIFFFFQAEDGIRYRDVTGVQTCALPISGRGPVEGEPFGVARIGCHTDAGEQRSELVFRLLAPGRPQARQVTVQGDRPRGQPAGGVHRVTAGAAGIGVPPFTGCAPSHAIVTTAFATSHERITALRAVSATPYRAVMRA